MTGWSGSLLGRLVNRFRGSCLKARAFCLGRVRQVIEKFGQGIETTRFEIIE